MGKPEKQTTEAKSQSKTTAQKAKGQAPSKKSVKTADKSEPRKAKKAKDKDEKKKKPKPNDEKKAKPKDEKEAKPKDEKKAREKDEKKAKAKDEKKAQPKSAAPSTPKSAAAPTKAPTQAATTTGSPQGPFTLAIDIGGTGLKASVLDREGAMTTERVRIDTPQPCTPTLLLAGLVELSQQLVALGQRWDRVSVGFPGLIRHGVIITAPNLGTAAFAGFDLKRALEAELSAPVRAVNDADMQGLAAISGKGVEMVCTLGTGFGTALFQDGRLQTHLEIAHLPFRKGETYDAQLGDRAKQAIGTKKWLRRVHEAIDNLFILTCYDHLYIGGGNARKLDPHELPKNVTLVDNSAGILGGIRLWDDLLEDV